MVELGGMAFFINSMILRKIPRYYEIPFTFTNSEMKQTNQLLLLHLIECHLIECHLAMISEAKNN